MAHEFKNHEKITALQDWVESIQSRIDRVKDALQDADTMDRWEGVPAELRDKTLQNLIENSRAFSQDVERWAEPCSQFKVSSNRYNEAFDLAYAISIEVTTVDKETTFKVPVWATGRVAQALTSKLIRYSVRV